MNIFLFEVDLIKFNTEEIYETVHVMAYNLFQASHIVMEALHDEESPYGDIPLDIGGIRKMYDVKKILNPAFIIDMMEDENEDEASGYNQEMPYKVVENLPDSDPRVMKFKCSCKEEIRVHKGDWLFIECRNCHNKIYRKEVEEVGNMFVYIKRNIDSE